MSEASTVPPYPCHWCGAFAPGGRNWGDIGSPAAQAMALLRPAAVFDRLMKAAREKRAEADQLRAAADRLSAEANALAAHATQIAMEQP